MLLEAKILDLGPPNGGQKSTEYATDLAPQNDRCWSFWSEAQIGNFNSVSGGGRPAGRLIYDFLRKVLKSTLRVQLIINNK